MFVHVHVCVSLNVINNPAVPLVSYRTNPLANSHYTRVMSTSFYFNVFCLFFALEIQL